MCEVWIYTSKMNQKTFIKFLQRLISGSKQKIFLILDNLKVHHGKIVNKWVSDNKEKIQLFYIPSYAPELNPDEYLNRDLKKNVNSSRIPRSIDELKKNISSFMRMLQRTPQRVVKYFHSRYIDYARAVAA